MNTVTVKVVCMACKRWARLEAQVMIWRCPICGRTATAEQVYQATS